MKRFMIQKIIVLKYIHKFMFIHYFTTLLIHVILFSVTDFCMNVNV